MKKSFLLKTTFTLIFSLFTIIIFAHPIDDFYKKHKNDVSMESKKIPPKVAAMMIDDDYTDAIDILKSLRSLKYLNFYGDEKTISNYAKSAIKERGNYSKLLDTVEGTRSIIAFGQKKKNVVKKIIVIVETPVQFILIVAKGKLNSSQIAKLPALSQEIQ